MNIQSNIILRDKNWFQTGGNARLFAEPRNADEFAEAISYANVQKAPIFVLGQGANILIADEGFSGLVIRPQITTISKKIDGNNALVTAGAGLSMHDLIDWCLDNNIFGLEEFSGIPGTIGGSVCMNLHYYQWSLDQFFVSAEVINYQTMAIQQADKEWFAFGYDQSKLQNGLSYLLTATFALTHNPDPCFTAFARGRRTEIIRHRVARYPSKNTCGSFFRNFHENEIPFTINNKKIIHTAYYLDAIGCKGSLTYGGARVSPQHANMIVTDSYATSADVINLARTMQEKVYEKFGIVPQPECQLIGFSEYPLLKPLK